MRQDRAQLNSTAAEVETAAGAIADLEAASYEIERLWKEDRAAMRTLITNVVDRIDLYDYDPETFGAAEVHLKTGGVYNLILE